MATEQGPGTLRLIVTNLCYVALLPGTATVLLPAVILHFSGPGRPPAATAAAGLVLMAAGALTALLCVSDFAWTGKGTLAPVDPPRFLVRRRLYRAVRNPMYVGIVTLVLGEALFFGSWRLALYAVLLFSGFHLFVVLYEEPALARRFGDSYLDFKKTVPRWLPKWPGPLNGA